MSIISACPLPINNNANVDPVSITHYSQTYRFYQHLNTNCKSSKVPIRIIPSIPRQHFRPSKNSSLSPIRSQKIIPKFQSEDENILKVDFNTLNSPEAKLTTKRPYPLITAFSSPASIQTTSEDNKKLRRKARVSFNEKVVVVCIIADQDDNESVLTSNRRRRSTGETTNYPKSILIEASPPLTKKVLTSVKQFMDRLLLV
ncbi:MAG: hypothetical protein EXX96DRAFT_541872 [Benjaminiella poitrasii]|nr:MAG: hypothetical protein EXX96DRAFT_541872 [Benjaminiella poitrasii]